MTIQCSTVSSEGFNSRERGWYLTIGVYRGTSQQKIRVHVTYGSNNIPRDATVAVARRHAHAIISYYNKGYMLPKLTPLSFMLNYSAQTADLQTEVAQLKAKLAEAANAQARAVSAIEARHDAAVAREQELNDEVRRARQAAERASCSRENDVIEMEKAMHTSHERQVYVLQERVSRTEERVRIVMVMIMIDDLLMHGHHI